MQPTATDGRTTTARTPTTAAAPMSNVRWIQIDANDQSHADAKFAAFHSVGLPAYHHPQQQPQHHVQQYTHQQRQQQSQPPRPQLHHTPTHFQSLPTQMRHVLPPLTVSSISPPNSSRPLIGLAPLRSVNRQCRLPGCMQAAKPQGLCLDHQQQQQPQQQLNTTTNPVVSSFYYQQPHTHIHTAATAFTHSPLHHTGSPAGPRPTLPPFSIPSLLSASPPSQQPFHLNSHNSSPRSHTYSPHSHHHHPYNSNNSSNNNSNSSLHRRAPLLPSLRTVGLPSFDDHRVVVSPAGSSAAPSPTSSTSSYSSYGRSSETGTGASIRTPPASASTTPLSATATRTASTASSTGASAAKPATKCRREHCVSAARRKGLCMEHGGRHFCKMDGCAKCAHRGGFCISHGGGRRCAVANCTKSAQSGGICYSHGGGKRCATAGCSHAARSGGFCIKHGKQQTSSTSIDNEN